MTEQQWVESKDAPNRPFDSKGRKHVMRADHGDWLIVESLHTGAVRRRGMVLETHGSGGSPPFLIRWTDDDHESLVFPGPDAHVEKAEPHMKAETDI